MDAILEHYCIIEFSDTVKSSVSGTVGLLKK